MFYIAISQINQRVAYQQHKLRVRICSMKIDRMWFYQNNICYNIYDKITRLG